MTIYACQWVEATHGFETAPSTSYHDTEQEAEQAAETQRKIRREVVVFAMPTPTPDTAAEETAA